MAVATAVAGFIVWLGAAVLVLSDGRRGVALGVAIAGAGLAFLGWTEAGLAPAALVLGGAAVSAAARLRSDREGWVMMPAGSTPRLILCVASGLLSLWIAASVTNGAGAAVRYGVFAAIVLAGGRIISALDRDVILASVGLLALAMAVGAGLGSSAPGIAPFVAGAIVAAGSALIRSPVADAA